MPNLPPGHLPRYFHDFDTPGMSLNPTALCIDRKIDERLDRAADRRNTLKWRKWWLLLAALELDSMAKMRYEVTVDIIRTASHLAHLSRHLSKGYLIRQLNPQRVNGVYRKLRRKVHLAIDNMICLVEQSRTMTTQQRKRILDDFALALANMVSNTQYEGVDRLWSTL
ncbi:hypothetical protein BC567DRAFT_267001 [Phyllosticta citribraziliensis]